MGWRAKTGAHYHKIVEDGNTRIPDETGNTHFAPNINNYIPYKGDKSNEANSYG